MSCVLEPKTDDLKNKNKTTNQKLTRMTDCCSVLEMEWPLCVPSCRPVSVCDVGQRACRGRGGGGHDRLLCCNKNTWIYSPSLQCWTEFCYIMRKETPSTDVGRVLIIGELHRKQTTESGGGGGGWRIATELSIFISHSTILHRLLTFIRVEGSEKKPKQNKTLNHKPAFGTNCTAVGGVHIQTQSWEEAHALDAGAPILYRLLCSTSCFRIIKANVRSPKREARFADSLWVIGNMYLQSDASTITLFSFQSIYKSHTFILFYLVFPNNAMLLLPPACERAGQGKQ